MSGIVPIPTTRVGDLFIRQRLAQQAQLDQLALFKLQTQISTGQRLQLPSEDAPAALRAISLQRLLDRKGQVQTNLAASNSYLSAAEASLGHVSTLLSNLRGDVVGVIGTTVPDSARQELIQEIDRVVSELVSAGNAKYQGRYLFSGSQSQLQPYDFDGPYVKYLGNEGVLRNYVDLERLFETNLSGVEVFGGISASVQGAADLDPHLTASTLVSTLNGGAGIGSNPAVTISVTAGSTTETKVVDLSGAVTIGDITKLIERGAPAGTSVEVTGDGLVLRTTGDAIQVSEVARGSTARQLGILSPKGAPASNTLTGGDLNPALLKTTSLATLLGTKARGVITSAGANNDIDLTANSNGLDYNNVTVVFQAGGTAGSELATFSGNTLTVQVEAGKSTASQVAAAITAEGTFTAVADYHDALTNSQIGISPVEVTTFSSVTTGGSGADLDTTSGLVLTNGGQTVTLDISEAETVEDLLNLINGAGIGLLAEINATKNGINIRSRLSGSDLTIGENGGTTAAQLGVRTYTEETKLSALNRGLGVPTSIDPANDDFVITARDGTQLAINLNAVGAEATSIADVINLINNHPANVPGNVGDPQPIEARLAATGNGIELIDRTSGPLGSEALVVSAVEGSQAAKHLGFVPAGQNQAASTTTDGDGNAVLQSEDRNTLETGSVFNTLLRLKTALEQNDEAAIGRSLELLDAGLGQVNSARAELGARIQNLDIIDIRLQDENVQLQAALSKDLDVDLVEAISNLTARQYAYQASLQISASTLQMSLLNFI